MRTLTVLYLLLSLSVSSASAQAPSSAGSWRVDAATQRERDTTRKAILEDELASEAKQFADAHAELRQAFALRTSPGKIEDIAERMDLHRRNIAELGREIERVEKQADIPIGVGPRRAVERFTDNWLVPSQATSPGDSDGAPRTSPRESLPARNRNDHGQPGWIIRATQSSGSQ